MIVALDGTELTVVQPTMQRDLDASFVQVQWTSTGYLIAVASLLVFAGRLGDRYGHRRLFAVGALGFAATSAGVGLAPGVGWVIALRVAQGVFGALLQPATLGMLRATYPRGQLGMPIALRMSAIGVAAAAGPVVGGALAAHLGWRWVFFLSVVPALAAGVLALVVREPELRRARDVPLDLPGACLLAVTLVCLVLGLVAAMAAGPAPGAAMGYDLAVWEGERPADNTAARAVFGDLYDWFTEGWSAPPTPHILTSVPTTRDEDARGAPRRPAHTPAIRIMCYDPPSNNLAVAPEAIPQSESCGSPVAMRNNLSAPATPGFRNARENGDHCA